MVLLTASGCANRQPVDDTDMEALLRELFMAQGMVEQVESLRRMQADSALEVYAPILERHGFTIERLDSMLAVYSVNPKRFDAILDHVIATIEEAKELLVELDSITDSAQIPPFTWQEGWRWITQLGNGDDTSVCCKLSTNQ